MTLSTGELNAYSIEDRRAAARLVESWGYPRKVWWCEVEECRWYTDRPQTGIVWFAKGMDRDTWIVHGCGKPGVRRPVLSAETLDTIRCLGRRIGARRLYAPIPVESRALARYLTMRGWCKAESVLGPFLEVR